jgi:CTD small phosphatase-like protein 2
VILRPYAQEFIDQISEFYEIAFFTASNYEYASVIMEKLDKNHKVAQRLFKNHCTLFKGAYVKDLLQFERNLKDVIIIDVMNMLNIVIKE